MTYLSTGPSLRDVDAAVTSVLAELFGPRGNGSTNGRAVKGSPDESVFAGRLLSLHEAERVGTRERVVKVAPGTVVTPLARDYLKNQGIELRFVARSEVDRLRNAGEWGFAIESKTGVLEAFRRSILDGHQGWTELGSSLDEAASWVSEGDGRGALLLTDEAALALYLAYQTPRVRAALAEGPDAAARAVRSIGVNLLIVEPAGKSIALLKQIGATFRRPGGPVEPEWAVERDGRVTPLRIAEVIGRVTLSRQHPNLKGGRYVIALPMPIEALLEDSPKRGEEVITYDILGASPGDLIGLSEGREAANPFGKTKVPVDAYCACLLDRISV